MNRAAHSTVTTVFWWGLCWQLAVSSEQDLHFFHANPRVGVTTVSTCAVNGDHPAVVNRLVAPSFLVDDEDDSRPENDARFNVDSGKWSNKPAQALSDLEISGQDLLTRAPKHGPPHRC